MIQIIQALRSCVTVALYPPVTKRPELLPIMPTPENVLDHLQRTKPNGIPTIPSNLQVWSHNPKSVDILKGLKFVVRRLLFLVLDGIFHYFLVFRSILAERSLQRLVLYTDQQRPELALMPSRGQKKKLSGITWSSVKV